MSTKLFEIWCEGDPRRDYTACHLGYGKGVDLREACEDLASRNPYFEKAYNPYIMKYHGCKVFDTEQEARLTHG